MRRHDCIKTALFSVEYVFGNPEPSDDLFGGELRWFPVNSLSDMIADKFTNPNHSELLGYIFKKYAK